jgi:membrane protein YdbS with pleckstrin-like domain
MPAQLLTYRCPYCQHAIEVDPALAEQTVTCSNPECQKPFHPEVPSAKPTPSLIVPHDLDGRSPLEDGPARPVEPARPAAPAPPPAAPAERDVLTVKPVMFRRYPYRCLGYVASILAGLVCVALWAVEGWLALGLLGIFVAAMAAFRLLAWWLRNRTTSLTVTTRRLILRAGAFTSHSTEIPYKEILDVQVHQSVLNRMMKVGDLTLFTRMPDKPQILLMAIPDPEGIAAEIRKLRQP